MSKFCKGLWAVSVSIICVASLIRVIIYVVIFFVPGVLSLVSQNLQ